MLPSSSLPYLSPDLHLRAADCRAGLLDVCCLLTLALLRRCNIRGRSLRHQGHKHSLWAQHHASAELAAAIIVRIDTSKIELSGDGENEGRGRCF